MNIEEKKAEEQLALEAKMADAKKKGAILMVEHRTDFGERKFAFFKKPTRPILAAALSKSERDPVGSNEIILKNCIIAELSDSDYLTDDAFFFALTAAIPQLIEVKQVEITKL